MTEFSDPLADAYDKAAEIVARGYKNMFVSISFGGEYINSWDVTAKMEIPLEKQIQQTLNDLKAPGTPLLVDGKLGPKSLTCILNALTILKAAKRP